MYMKECATEASSEVPRKGSDEDDRPGLAAPMGLVGLITSQEIVVIVPLADRVVQRGDRSQPTRTMQREFRIHPRLIHEEGIVAQEIDFCNDGASVDLDPLQSELTEIEEPLRYVTQKAAKARRGKTARLAEACSPLLMQIGEDFKSLLKRLVRIGDPDLGAMAIEDAPFQLPNSSASRFGELPDILLPRVRKLDSPTAFSWPFTDNVLSFLELSGERLDNRISGRDAS